MLLHLSIKNFAIIKHTEIDFRDGMTVLTGETGAGKSILLDALSFVLGARLEKTFIKSGETTEVSATFYVQENKNLKNLLDELFIDVDDECIIRRVVNKSGQSRIYINGSVSKAADVKLVSDKLINIYSQNSHQDLLDHKMQLGLLDGFANNDDLLVKVKESFVELQNIEKKITHVKDVVDTKKSQKELLKYKLDELLQLELYETEFDDLSDKQKSLSCVDEQMSSLSLVCDVLNDSDENVISALSTLEKELAKFSEDKTFSNMLEMISQTKVYARESYDEANNLLESIEQNPEELARIDARMSTIYDLARKHKVEPSYLYKFIDEIQAELDSISADNQELIALESEKAELELLYKNQAQKLSQSRQKAAKVFSKEVEKSIRSLNIPKGSFVAQISQLDNYTDKGFDSCEFLINFNLGEELAPVKKVASGGELSRIGLSIQTVSAEKRSYPTLVFDEVDVGISGATAEIVGKLLQKLSQKLQVLCITHQAQVAAQGSTHLHVQKKYLKDTTESKIVELDIEQRVQEIAKIVGGVDISENTLKHARDMLSL